MKLFARKNSRNVKPSRFDIFVSESSEWILAGLAALLIAILYVALSTSFSFRFQERAGSPHYGMLAQAFASGQLHLKEQLDPRRANSEDPRDPTLPYPFIGDTVIWQGKYYFQHEPLPGLLRAVWLKLAGVAVPTGLAVLLCLAGILVGLAAVLRLVRQHFFPDCPTWIAWFVWLAFALSGPQLYLASRPVVYHESVAMGGCFVLGGTVILIYGLTHSEKLFVALALSGLSFGAASLCRAWLGIYPIVFIICFGYIYLRDHEPRRHFWTLVAAFGFPIACSVAVLLIYNFLRFGDPLDFGRRHAIWFESVDYIYLTRDGLFFRIQHVPLQLYHYLLALPSVTNKTGILRYPIERLWVGDAMVLRELASSVFVMVPTLLLALPFPFFYRYGKKNAELSLILLFCAFGPLAMLLLLCFHFAATVRYVYDFLPLIFVLIFFNLAVLWDKVKDNRRRRRTLMAALLVLFVANCLMGVFMALSGIFTQA